MKIEFYTKNVYGNELMYIKDDDTADSLTFLLGTKTINHQQMGHLSSLFEIKWEEVLAPKKK